MLVSRFLFPFPETFSFNFHFIVSSAIASNLDWPKILLFGKVSESMLVLYQIRLQKHCYFILHIQRYFLQSSNQIFSASSMGEIHFKGGGGGHKLNLTKDLCSVKQKNSEPCKSFNPCQPARFRSKLFVICIRSMRSI